MADQPDPPRKFYQLKRREFEVVNDLPPAGSLSHPILSSPPPPKIEVRALYQPAATSGPLPAAGQKVAVRNDVHDILDGNLARANAAGLNELTYKPKRRSRRRRDYFIVVIPLDLFFAYAAFGHYANAATMAYGVAGIIISTLGIGWVMFCVMDDY